MDVTKLNFVEQLPHVRAAIRAAEFLAIDCEFTGLSSGGGTSSFDTPSERYIHLRESTQDYLVVQFGLAAFRYDQEKQEYVHNTFNFYLFPRSQSQGSFMFQPSSLEFLVDNGFDFNRLIRHGLPFLRPAHLDNLRDRLQKQMDEKLAEEQTPNKNVGSSSKVSPQPVPENQTQFFKSAIAEIKQFLGSSEEHLDFDNLTGFQRKLLYDHADANVTVPLELETLRLPGDKRRLRISRRLSRQEREQRLRQNMEDRLTEAAGFSSVFSAISESGKPVVGHNMLLDLIHIVHQFVCPLPDTYDEFKAVLNTVFPCIVDTKVMASTRPFKDQIPNTGLPQLTEALAGHPFKMPTTRAEGSDNNYVIGDEKHHEAGYDAYLTGMCFASMLNYLGLLMTPPQPVLSPSADIVKPFTNKIFAFRLADMIYLNLSGEDVVPKLDHVFHVTFPEAWKTHDIIRVFIPFTRVHVEWIDDTSAFVSLDRRDQASQVLQNVKATTLFKLSTYAQWREVKHRSQYARTATPSQTHATNPATGAVRRKRSSSSTCPESPQSVKDSQSVDKGRPRSASISLTGEDVGQPVTPKTPAACSKRKRKFSDPAQNGKGSKEDDVDEPSAPGVFEVPEW